MKILLFGKNGQVGWELQRSLAPLGEVIALDFDSTEFCGDLSNLAGLAQTVREIAPNAIVNAAAYTAVDRAESEADLAQLINAAAPGVLADEAQKLGATLLHYSTDYVFDGSGDQARAESAIPNPLNVYGKTKLAGEQAAMRCARHLIFRTSWVYAARGANFAKTMLRLAQERAELNVIHDQMGAPTGAELLADVSAHALRSVQQSSDQYGLYHLAASGVTSWHGYAQWVIESARQKGLPIKTSPDAIHPIASSAYPTPAARPLNSRLNTQKVRENFALTLPDWKVGVTRMLDELLG